MHSIHPPFRLVLQPQVVILLLGWLGTWHGHGVIVLRCVDSRRSRGGRGPQRRTRRPGRRDRLTARPDGRAAPAGGDPPPRAGKFVLGLLADLPRKNYWAIAEHAGQTVIRTACRTSSRHSVFLRVSRSPGLPGRLLPGFCSTAGMVLGLLGGVGRPLACGPAQGCDEEARPRPACRRPPRPARRAAPPAAAAPDCDRIAPAVAAALARWRGVTAIGPRGFADN